MMKRVHMWTLKSREGMIALQGVDLTKNMLVVADLNDEVGGPLAQAIAEAEGTDAFLETHKKRVEQRGEIPTAIMVVPILATSRLLAAVNPMVGQTLRALPPAPGTVWVAVIAFGGTSLLQPPYIPVRSAGSA